MKHLLDFEQIIGLVTPSARKISSSWDEVNLASAENSYSQNLANYFISYHTNLLQRPDLTGLIEFSGSTANERALKIAKEKTGKTKVLMSNLAHSSIQHAAQGQTGFFSGIGLEPIIVDVDHTANFQVNSDQLKKIIDQHGKEIAVIVSTYGTTQLGHAENIATQDSVKQLREDGTWLHVDAAYGGCYTLHSSFISHTIPDADSYTLDPYKFVGKPGCSLLLIKPTMLLPLNVPYYEKSNFTPYTTHSMGPIVAWAQMVKDYEPAGLQELANDCVLEARLAGMQLKSAGVDLLYGPKMTIVPLRLYSQEQALHVRENLRQQGYQVGKLHIVGQDYQIDGIRFTVTPQVPEFHQLRRFVPALISTLSPSNL